MEDCANAYTAYIMEIVETTKQNCPDPEVLIEQRLDYSRWVEEGFGTADCIVIADGTLHVIDYKNGAGVVVEAADNPQMKLYALGALELFDCIYEINEVAMTVFQPRRDNISTHTVFKESLYQWAENVLKPAATIAYEGGGEFTCGDWCQFCKAKATCRKRAEENMTLAAYDFTEPATLSNDEITAILAKVDELTSWASDIKSYALTEALKGAKFDGFKVVEGRSNRRYINADAVADAVGKAGYDPYERSVLGLTAMEAMLGKKRFAELLEGLIEKPAGKPTLVPNADKRQELNITTAADDFADSEN